MPRVPFSTATVGRSHSSSKKTIPPSHSTASSQRLFDTNSRETVVTDVFESLLYPGEHIVAEKLLHREYDKSFHKTLGQGKPFGVLLVSNFRLIFISQLVRINALSFLSIQEGDVSIEDVASDVHDFIVPLRTINKIEKRSKGRALRIHCKDFRLLRLSSSIKGDVHHLYQHMIMFAFPGVSTRTFAFFHQLDSGRGAVDAYVGNDLKRLGCSSSSSSLWRISTANAQYQLCRSYPHLIGVPASFTDDQLRKVAEFRSKERIPILSWLHPRTGASVTRAAQPLVGFSGSRSKHDEALLRSISSTNRVNPGTLYIMDARPRVNAAANLAKGAGFEIMTCYEGATLEFLGIDNIHVMRESERKLRELCLSSGEDDSRWFVGLQDTQWLEFVHLLLTSSARIARLVSEEEVSVFVHCSDGWDRTSQLCGLSLIMLDPFYRTLEGFATLVEKEWLGAGHKFDERAGHTESNDESSSDRSPIFLQWMDAVFQLTRQYPTCFEWNEAYLGLVVDAHYSCEFGTFLFNCARERAEARVWTHTPSLWVHVNRPTQRMRYTNAAYAPLDSVIYPKPGMKHLVLWRSYYMRHAQPSRTHVAAPSPEESLEMKHAQQIGQLERRLEAALKEKERLSRQSTRMLSALKPSPPPGTPTTTGGATLSPRQEAAVVERAKHRLLAMHAEICKLEDANAGLEADLASVREDCARKEMQLGALKRQQHTYYDLCVQLRSHVEQLQAVVDSVRDQVNARGLQGDIVLPPSEKLMKEPDEIAELVAPPMQQDKRRDGVPRETYTHDGASGVDDEGDSMKHDEDGSELPASAARALREQRKAVDALLTMDFQGEQSSKHGARSRAVPKVKVDHHGCVSDEKPEQKDPSADERKRRVNDGPMVKSPRGRPVASTWDIRDLREAMKGEIEVAEKLAQQSDTHDDGEGSMPLVPCTDGQSPPHIPRRNDLKQTFAEWVAALGVDERSSAVFIDVETRALLRMLSYQWILDSTGSVKDSLIIWKELGGELSPSSCSHDPSTSTMVSTKADGNDMDATSKSSMPSSSSYEEINGAMGEKMHSSRRARKQHLNRLIKLRPPMDELRQRGILKGTKEASGGGEAFPGVVLRPSDPKEAMKSLGKVSVDKEAPATPSNSLSPRSPGKRTSVTISPSSIPVARTRPRQMSRSADAADLFPLLPCDSTPPPRKKPPSPPVV